METKWKDVVGYEGLYEVSENGDVRSKSRIVPSRYKTRKTPEKVLKKFVDKDGYYRVNLCSKNIKATKIVHRLVAEAFIPNPNNYPVVNHKDENKTNNHFKNLEWCTIKYNTCYGDGIERRASKRRIPIIATKSGKEYTFKSIAEASTILNINHANIIGCLKEKYGRKTCKGFAFRYAERMVQAWKAS